MEYYTVKRWKTLRERGERREGDKGGEYKKLIKGKQDN
jgi:hypothetical protein